MHIADEIINPFVMASRTVILNCILNISYIVGIFYVHFKQVIFLKFKRIFLNTYTYLSKNVISWKVGNLTALLYSIGVEFTPSLSRSLC